MSVEEKVFRSLSPEETANILCQKQRLLILFHVHPDADAAGSAFALKSFFDGIGRSAWCLCADPMPERIAFISEGIQESVLPEDMPEDISPDLIMSVDSASPSQLGRLYELYGEKIELMIDHHGKGTPYADNCIEASASSCGELLYKVLKAMVNKLGIDEIPFEVCERIYAAVSSDTGCFRYNNVTSSTHLVAAELVGRGVGAAEINHKLFGIKTLKQMQVENAGFERMNLHLGGRLAVITFPYDLKVQYGALDEHLETLIDVARCVKGVDVAVVIRQPTVENKFRVSMRSSCDFDVSEICALYGGGGHARAAGCGLSADSILSAEMTIVVAVEERLK